MSRRQVDEIELEYEKASACTYQERRFPSVGRTMLR